MTTVILSFRHLIIARSARVVLRRFAAQDDNAIAEIHAGGAPINGNVARIIMEYMSSLPRPSILDTLTDRERDVLALLADRKQYKEIADLLFMSIDTVRTHVRGIYSKLNVHKRTAAAKVYRDVTSRE